MDLKGQHKNSYVIYTRKSTDDAHNQKNSISYQRIEGVRYARREQLSIANMDIPGFCTSGIVTERHTGFKEGENFTISAKGVQYAIERPKFHKLVELLWQGEIKGAVFLCWDRASRNKTDNTILRRLIDRNVDIRFVQAKYERTSSGELHMDIDSMFSEHYSRAIREKVSDTTRKLRDEGICTYRAPVGYLNLGDPRNKPLDPVRAPIIKEIFERYATGRWSLSDLARWANVQGLTMPAVRQRRTDAELLNDDEVVHQRVSRLITVNHIHNLLRNPFYIGKVRGNNGVYIQSRSHIPLVDESLFNRIQASLKNRRVSCHYTTKLDLPYRGLVRCSGCNRAYTPYLQKGIYYYGARCASSCTNKTKNINAAFIEQEVGTAIKRLSFTDEELAEIDCRSKVDIVAVDQKRAHIAEANQRQIKQVRDELSYLTTHKLTLLKTGTYSPEEYIIENGRLNEKLAKLSSATEASQTSTEQLLQGVVKLSELVKNTYRAYQFAIPAEKESIIGIIFSELKISGKSLIYKAKKGFQSLENHSFVAGEPTTWLSEAAHIQTDIQQSIADVQQLLAEKGSAP
jgi:site-specific DNA recombinase